MMPSFFLSFDFFFFCYSNFSDVFAVVNGVKVITKLPKEMDSSMKKLKYFKSWSGMDCYQEGDSKHLG